MRKGDVIVNPFVKALFYGKPNPNYAVVFVKRLDCRTIQTLGIDGELGKFMCKKSEEADWRIVGHVDLNLFKMIKPFVEEWCCVM